jgi:hypothetical protein
MTLKSFIKDLNGTRSEGELIKTIALSLLSSFIILGILYFVAFKNVPNFIAKYSFFLFFSALSYSIIVPVFKQVRAFKQFPCMSGMMIGMTVGMVAGFLAGYYIGATNGLFVGAVFGMAVGIILGIWLGSCCGVMGFMEGTMAGFMSGPMGAMTSVMLLSDNLRPMTVIVFLVGALIIFSLNYMIYLETKGAEEEKTPGAISPVWVASILIIITALIMVYGPRSYLFS